MAASSDPLAIGLAIVALRGRWHLLTLPVVARPPTRPTCAMAMTMHVTHDQHVVKAATLAHDELSRSQVMHWHAYGPLWWPVVALMTRPQHLEHHPWTTEHGGVARCTGGLVCLKSW